MSRRDRLRLALYGRLSDRCSMTAILLLRISGWALQKQSGILERVTGRPILVKEDMQP